MVGQSLKGGTPNGRKGMTGEESKTDSEAILGRRGTPSVIRARHTLITISTVRCGYKTEIVRLLNLWRVRATLNVYYWCGRGLVESFYTIGSQSNREWCI